MITFALCFKMGKALGGGHSQNARLDLATGLSQAPILGMPPPRGFILHIKSINIIIDIRKVRKRQHRYPEFGHTQGEIEKKPAKKVH